MLYNYNNVNYEIVIEKKKQKNTYIRVKEDLKIYVTTTFLTPDFMINKLIKENTKSINKMIDNQIKKNDNKKGYHYLGKEITIFIIPTVKKPYLEDNYLYVNSESQIEKWFKQETKRIFKERLDYNYSIFTEKIPYPILSIRKMTTRWGVNNRVSKKVTLNSELIHMDIKYLDYVIVHELSHFIHFDHSKSFWSLVEKNCPDYKQIRKEMR